MFKKYKNSYLSYIFLYAGFYLAFAAYSAVLSVYLTGIGKNDREMSLILSSAGLFSLGLETGILWLFVEELRCSEVIVKLCANVLVVVVNYVLSKFIIFRKKQA